MKMEVKNDVFWKMFKLGRVRCLNRDFQGRRFHFWHPFRYSATSEVKGGHFHKKWRSKLEVKMAFNTKS